MNGMMMNSGGGQGQQMMMGNQMGRTMSSPQGQMGGGQVMMGNNNMGRMGQQTMSMPGQMGGGQVMTMGNNMGKMGQQMGQQTMTMPGQMGGGQVMMMGNNTSTGQQTMPMSGQMGGGQVMTMGNNKMGQQTMSMPGQMGGGRGMNQIGNMHRPQSQMPIMPTGMQNPMMMQGSNQMMSNQMGGMMMQPTMKSMGSMNRRVQMMPNQMGGMGKVMSMPQNQMMMGGGQVMMGNQMGGMGQNQMQMMTGPNQMPMGNQQVNQGSPPTTGGETGMTFFDAVFPANSPLGLTVEDAHISYSVNVGNTVNMNRIEVCMVVASQSQTAILPGDVICSINNEKTINLPDSQGDVSKTPRIVALGIITQQQHMKRTLKIMRFRDPVSVLKAGTVLRFDNPEVLAQLFGYVGGNDQLMNNNNNSSSSNSNNNISSVPQQETTCHATYLAITFPPNQDSLGLKLEPIRKSYTLEETGQYKTIDCCIVTSSSISQYFRNGDILVKINGLALNSPTAKVSTNATEQDTFCSIVANKLKNANRTKGRTLVVLRQMLRNAGGEEAAAVDHPEVKPSLVLQHEDEEIMFTDDIAEVEAGNNHGHDHAHGHSHGHGGNCTMDHGHDAAGSHAADGHDHSHGHDHQSSNQEIQRRADEEMRKLRAAEEREREARQAVEVQRKLAEEAQQRAAEINRSPNIQQGVSEVQSLIKSGEKLRRGSIEEVIHEQAIWV